MKSFCVLDELDNSLFPIKKNLPGNLFSTRGFVLILVVNTMLKMLSNLFTA